MSTASGGLSFWESVRIEEIPENGKSQFLVSSLPPQSSIVPTRWHLGRETFVVPVQWIDDWPIINGGDEIRLGSELEAGTETLWRDDFSDPVLGLGWYRKSTSVFLFPSSSSCTSDAGFIDTPEKLDHAITSNPSRLRLYGGPYNLSVPASPTMFLRKQTSRCCVWETKISFHPMTEHEEAGSVLWWNYLTYSSIGIRKARSRDGMNPAPTARMIHFRSARGDTVSRLLEQPDSDVFLYIRCGKKYEFGFRELVGPGDEDGPIQWLGEASNEVMTSPPSAGLAFSGMMFGLYAFADYQRSLNAAEFHYAQIKLIGDC